MAGGVLYVVGGWELRGPDQDAVWADTVLALGLDGAAEWRAIPAPFERRALAAGTAAGRIYVLGGLTPDVGPQLRVDVLDIAAGEWSGGPDLPPAGSLQGFGVAAASHRDRVFVSQADGKVYSLGSDTDSWELVATLASRRFMHRLVLIGDHLLAVGGSWRSGHLATIEVVSTMAEAGPAGPDPRRRDRLASETGRRVRNGRRSGRWGSEVSVRFVEAYQHGSEDQFAPAAYQVVDLVGFVSLAQSLKFRLGLLNLTDSKYFGWWNVRGRQANDPVIDRYSSPGLSVISSLGYDW